MLKKHEWLPLSLLLISSLVLGIIIDVIIKDWPVLKLKTDVDVVAASTSILSLIVTICVARWVAIVLEKKNSDTRTEKDIIIRHVGLLYEIIEDTRLRVQSGKINITIAVSNTKRIYMNSREIINRIDFIDNKHLTSISTNTQHVNNLLTGNTLNDLELTVKDGEILISESRQAIIDTALDKLRWEILSLELVINRG